MKAPFVFILAGAFVAGCASNTPAGGCASLAPPPVLVYPSPGATAVPTTVGEVIVTDASAQDTVSVFSGGQSFNALPLHDAPTPYPTALPTPASPAQYLAASLPQLTSGATYTVRATFLQPCGGETVNATLGTFTTM